MQMKNPPHPGRIVRQECLESYNLSVSEAAQRLGVHRQTLNQLLIGKSSITPEWLSVCRRRLGTILIFGFVYRDSMTLLWRLRTRTKSRSRNSRLRFWSRSYFSQWEVLDEHEG